MKKKYIDNLGQSKQRRINYEISQVANDTREIYQYIHT